MGKDVSISAAITDMIEWMNGNNISEFQKGMVAGRQVACGMAEMYEVLHNERTEKPGCLV